MLNHIEFKAALGNTDYQAQISSNAANQVEFIARLEHNQFKPQDLIEFIPLVQNLKVRTLLIIHLLTQQVYLDALMGEPLQNRLSSKDHVKPSRLNQWIHQLDVSILSPELINKLPIEVAISILCAPPHFHQLTQEQVSALLKKYPEYCLLDYWVNNFSTMPNAHFMLAHLMKITGTRVIDVLNTNEAGKERVLLMIIKHLPLFLPLPSQLFSLFKQESYLILAINLYLNGHHYQAYTAFIETLTQHLLKQGHTFSAAAIDRLFAVNNVVELKHLMTNIAPLINAHLRDESKMGKVELFYEAECLQIPRMTQLIPFPSITTNGVEESPLIKVLAHQHKLITNFDYFLIHYQGTSDTLNKVLNDYLDYYLNEKKSEMSANTMSRLSFLLLREELAPQTKEALFATFLRYPELFNQPICRHLFLYNALKAIHHFGLEGGIKNYKTVIFLCELALKKLDPEKNHDLIELAHNAKEEAELELHFSQKKGFFARIVIYIKRCIFYGWTGFFSPNLPKYVIPESLPPKKITAPKMTVPFVKDLALILQEEIEEPTQHHLEQLIEAMSTYSLKETPEEEELEIRTKVHHLYSRGLTNPALSLWLHNHHNPFLENQFRLLELTLSKCSLKEFRLLMKKMPQNSTALQRLAEELNCPLPTEMPKPQESTAASGLLTAATETMSEIWDWAGGFFTATRHSLDSTLRNQGMQYPTHP